MHPKLAVQFAQWLSHDYAWTVSEVMEGYHRGDLAVAAQVVQNHDAINDTTSVVAIQSIGNSLLASDGLTVEQKRAKSIELTKDAHDKFARKGAKPTDFIDVHNAINQSAFNFDGPTHAFRETHGIPKGRTPRAYGQLEQQEAVVLMTMIAKGFFEQDEMSLRESKDKTIDRIKIIGGILKESGISTKPLLTQQITPDRSLVGGAISRPAITSSARMGIISNQGQIDAFFAPRSVSS